MQQYMDERIPWGERIACVTVLLLPRRMGIHTPSSEENRTAIYLYPRAGKATDFSLILSEKVFF